MPAKKCGRQAPPNKCRRRPESDVCSAFVLKCSKLQAGPCKVPDSMFRLLYFRSTFEIRATRRAQPLQFGWSLREVQAQLHVTHFAHAALAEPCPATHAIWTVLTA